jgi:uracil-DNA glycosylase
MRTLEVIQDEVKGCIKCELHETRTNTVFSRGNPNASLCFVGEAPGEDEDLQGLPFVGRSGQLLDKILTELGLDVQKDIYVCNIIKCRPPGNRRPSEKETNQCIDYLEEQLRAVNPKVVVALGNTAVSNLVATPYGITKIRGTFIRRGRTLVMPTYHPSYLLRNNNPASEPHVQFRDDIRSAIDKTREAPHTDDQVQGNGTKIVS